MSAKDQPSTSSSVPSAKDSLCVFCGSSPGVDAAYAKLATDLGAAIAQNRWRLVYGGGMKGLMGTLARATLDSKGSVLGVIPSVMVNSAPNGHPSEGGKANGKGAAASQEGSGTTQLTQHQILEDPLMETRVVASMHERKALMAKQSGRGFVGLPGGFGTFEEVFEMVTWSQLGIHNVPIVLPNLLNFWTPLQQLVEATCNSGFITPKGKDLLYFLQPEEVETHFGGNWGQAIIGAVQQMEKRLEGRQGYWKWNAPGEDKAPESSSAARQDFSGRPAAIEVDRLTYSFGPHMEPSLHDINLSLPQSSRTLLIGANGAGKSTLLRLLAGKRLVSTSSDYTPVKVFGRDVFNSPPSGITYLGTEWAMNPVVRSDIRVEDFLNSVGGYRYKERRDRLLDLLDVDIEWHMHAISDGERRRVQLCMGLMTPWTVLLLDEVTVDLDVQVRSDLLAFLKEETETRDATIVYATHIFDGLHEFPSHVVHMRLGGIVDDSADPEGTSKEPCVGNAIPWPPASIESSSANNSKDGLLLTLALGWLRKDRVIREEHERQLNQGQRRRGAKRGVGGDIQVETDSERFYTKYDYSQTVTR